MLPRKLPNSTRFPPWYGPPLAGFGAAVVLVLVSGILRFVLSPHGPIKAPFLLFYPAIGAAAYFGGILPGFAALAGSALFAHQFYIVPSQAEAHASGLALSVLGPLMVLIGFRIRYGRERKLAISRESARFRFISDNAAEWIFVVDDSGVIEYANQTAAGQLRRPQEQLRGRNLDELVPEQRRQNLKDLLQACVPGTPALAEMPFQPIDGPAVWMEVGCTRVQWGEDAVIYVSARDVSERRRMDRELRESRRWESLGVLAGGLAHDFNNLLTAVIGNASLARESLSDQHLVSVLLEGIEEAGEGCAELVRLMLATAAYRPRVTEALRMDRIFADLLLSRRAPAGVEIVSHAEETVFTGEQVSLETLLWNLVLNACESYGGAPGRVLVNIHSAEAPELAPGSFEEGALPAGKCLGICVEDAGCGMDKRTLDRAFDPFFTTKFAGRGLGLPAVRGLVRAYSGKLWVRTGPGQGTRVEVWLPENPPQSATL